MKEFGDGIDWSAEARRAAAEDAAKGISGVGRSELVDRLRDLLPPGALVLDAGCNIGRYVPLFEAAGLRYHGVDQSEEALRIARGLYPGVTFELGFVWDLALGGFDGAASFAVLQHNTYPEQERFVDAVARALRPGGIFVMSESTVPDATRTQRTHEGWIGLVTSHGFELLETWHPNPEYGLRDAYAFRRLGEVTPVADLADYDACPDEGSTHGVVDLVVDVDKHGERRATFSNYRNSHEPPPERPATTPAEKPKRPRKSSARTAL